MSTHGERLIVFAKAPEPGRVKTRLQLPPALAARVHEAFVRDVVARHEKEGREIVVWRAGDLAHPLWFDLGVELGVQPSGPLGARMDAALAAGLEVARKVVIVGTDSPSLPPSLVDQAFTALDEHPVVLGPACDGGYYLIGATGGVPAVFPDDMP